MLRVFHMVAERKSAMSAQNTTSEKKLDSFGPGPNPGAALAASGATAARTLLCV